MTRDRVKDRHRDRVILRTDLLADYDLHAGDVVDARFVDDDWAQVTVSDPDTGFDRVVKGAVVVVRRRVGIGGGVRRRCARTGI